MALNLFLVLALLLPVLPPEFRECFKPLVLVALRPSEDVFVTVPKTLRFELGRAAAVVAEIIVLIVPLLLPNAFFVALG
jgi:hypothetical protein